MNSAKTQAQPLYQDITIRSIKLVDIGYSAAFYFLCALLTVMLFHRIFKEFSPEEYDKKSTSRIIFDLILHVWLIGVFAYVARNVFALIPWPFENVYGYKHLKVKEVTNSAIFVAFTVTFDTYLQSQVGYLKRRLGIIK